MDVVHRCNDKTSLKYIVFYKILSYLHLCLRRRQMLDPFLIQLGKQASHFYQMTSRSCNS